MTDQAHSSGPDAPDSDWDKAESFPRRLTDGLWAVGDPYFNLYLVQGEQAAALIEVGVSGVTDQVIEQLRTLKVKPTFLVVTHPHADHLTGLACLKEEYRDSLIVTGAGAAEFVAHPRASTALIKEDRHMSQFLESKGFKPGRPPIEEPPALGDALTANDGDEMDLGNLTLRFLTVKGHSAGNINVYIPEIEALMCSDSLGFRLKKRGFYPLFFTGFSDHVATLERLKKLKPRILGVAHRGPRTGPEVPESFDQAIETSHKMREKILADPRDPEAIANDLYEESYKDEFLLYTPENIASCIRLLVKRARE